MMLLTFFFIVLAGTVLFSFLPSKLIYTQVSHLVFSGIALLLGASLAYQVFQGVPIIFSSYITIDAFSALILLLVLTLAFFSSFVSLRYVQKEIESGSLSEFRAKLYYKMLSLFIASMVLATMMSNLILLWVAIEATTLASTVLVALHKKDASYEAAWKYIILCSIGINIGLIGIFILMYAGSLAGMPILSTTFFAELIKNIQLLPVGVLSWGFVFLFIGIGTKVGFFPMHTWLPDAHGQTPAPVSALLSGVLLSVAFYALMKFKYIIDLSLGSSDWTNNFFMAFGLLSVGFAALVLLIQKNYKRMFAYSSIEHMGLIAFAVSLGQVGIIAAIMHIIGHAFSKSALFYTASEVLLEYKSTKIENIHSLLKRLPKTAILFLTALVSLLAFPPFPLFASEILMVSTAIKGGYIWQSIGIILALTLVCIGMFKHTLPMLYSTTIEASKRESCNITHGVIILEIIILLVLGGYFLSSHSFEFFQVIARQIAL